MKNKYKTLLKTLIIVVLKTLFLGINANIHPLM